MSTSNTNSHTMLKAVTQVLLFTATLISLGHASDDVIAQKEAKASKVSTEVRVVCKQDEIALQVSTSLPVFNGMIYPKGLAKNSTCMTEYMQHSGIIEYTLPLHSCNTMSTDTEDGIEYFNSIVVQPHVKLVTNHGRGFHIRCRYRTEGKHPKGESLVEAVLPTAAMPASSMHLYLGEPVDGITAEDVKIGDALTLVLTLDSQDVYGMHVSDCMVKDGLGWTEQQLINEDGCTLDKDIMGQLQYSDSKTTALVHFKAHKFPHTSSVYYQCNVRLCIKHAGGCDDVPPVCDANGENTIKKRRRRQTIELDETNGVLYDPDREDVKVKVYSGLYVNEASDFDEASLDDDLPEEIHSRTFDPNVVCFPQREFAIGMAIAGLILIVIVILSILCLLSMRRRRKDLSTTGSSIYSGSNPYTNTAYSHSS